MPRDACAGAVGWRGRAREAERTRRRRGKDRERESGFGMERAGRARERMLSSLSQTHSKKRARKGPSTMVLSPRCVAACCRWAGCGIERPLSTCGRKRGSERDTETRLSFFQPPHSLPAPSLSHTARTHTHTQTHPLTHTHIHTAASERATSAPAGGRETEKERAEKSAESLALI